jgi:hypothetical protein
MAQQVNLLHSSSNLSSDLVELIQKLRWSGLEEEAHQLEIVLSKIPPDERAVVCVTHQAPIENFMTVSPI